MDSRLYSFSIIASLKGDFMETILTLRQNEFNRRYERLPFASKQHLQKKVNNLPNRPIHVVYILNHTSVCGGVKVILEHAHYLTLNGLKVTLISHFERPTWLNWEGHYLQVPFTRELTYDIPQCDIIIATYWDHIQACIETHIAPVIYFEQGDYHLFERHTITPDLLHFIDTQFTLPNFFMTVSTPIATLIDTLYSQRCEVIPNALNTDYFNLAATPFSHSHPYILMLGSDETPFKGLDEIRLAYKRLKIFLPYLDLIWITPSSPSSPHFETALAFVNPSQTIIAQLYRGALAFISASHYESFSLPVLEAMSCACPVVTTNNLGVSEYAVHHMNALITPISNINALTETIFTLLTSPQLRLSLINGGLQTAKHYTWSVSISKLISFYKYVAQYEVAPT